MEDSETDALIEEEPPASPPPVPPPHEQQQQNLRQLHVRNILVLSFSFMCISTAYFTTSAIANSVIHDMIEPYGFHEGDGYIALAIISASQLLLIPVSPIIVSRIGGKWATLAGGCTHLLYIASFEFHRRWLVFLAAGIFGCGFGVYWVGAGVVLTQNSDIGSANKLTGLFWIIYNFSQIWGNLFVALKFQNLTVIDDFTREVTFAVLFGMAFVGNLLLLFLREHEQETRRITNEALSINTATNEDEVVTVTTTTSWRVKARPALKLLISPLMLLCLGSISFTGMNLIIFISPIPTAIGFNRHFPDHSRKRLMGIHGFCVGAAEIVGGTVVTLVLARSASSSSQTAGRLRSWIFSCGVMLAACALTLSVVNMPLDAPVHDSIWPTILFGYADSSIFICVVCALMFGASDAATNIAMMAFIADAFGHVYDHDDADSLTDEESDQQRKLTRSQATAAANAVVNGLQAALQAIVLILSPYIWLHCYLFMLLPVCVWSSWSFARVEQSFRRGRFRRYFID